MSTLIWNNLRWLVAMAGLVTGFASACSEAEGTEPQAATETNVAPAPCDSDDDCPGRCVSLVGAAGSGGEELRFCEPVARPKEPADPQR